MESLSLDYESKTGYKEILQQLFRLILTNIDFGIVCKEVL